MQRKNAKPSRDNLKYRSPIRELNKIRNILEHAYRKPSPSLNQRIYQRTQLFLKYVGLPALILASIIPVKEAITSYIEHQNKKFVYSIYTEYTVHEIKFENSRDKRP